MVTVTGGTLHNGLLVLSDSVVTVAGGSIGSYRDLIALNGYSLYASGPVSITDGNLTAGVYVVSGVVNVSGGTHLDYQQVGGVTNLSGGTVQTYFDVDGGTMHIYGSQFTLGGNDITSTLTEDAAFNVSTRDVTLSGTLADGSPFDMFLDSSFVCNTECFRGTLTITLVSGIPGDFNDDGVVNAADYTVWRNKVGTSVAVRGKEGDGNYDGEVTKADYYVWKKHFGDSAGGMGAGFEERFPANVPEPEGVVLLLMGLMMGVMRRRARVG
jgi:hypothetical protein